MDKTPPTGQQAHPARPPAPRIAPGPEVRGFAGHLPDFRASKVEFLTDIGRRFGEVVRLRFGPKVIHMVRHPDHVKAVLQDCYLNFEKASRGFTKLKMLLGSGLVTADGGFWQRQRRIAQPAFHHQRIAAFASTFSEAAGEALPVWAEAARRGDPLDVYQEMSRITLNSVVRTLLGADLPSGGFAAVNRGLEVALDYVNHNIYRLFDVPSFVPSRRRRRFEEAVRGMDAVVYGLIERGRRDEALSERPDLLSMLIAARDEESGEGMTDEQLRDQVMTILLAGHETTALALTWTWYLLSLHPQVRQTLRQEVEEVLGDRPPTVHDVPRLTRTTQVILEALRLYPPLWAFSRKVVEGFELGGYDIPSGSTLFLSPYVTHRHPEFWPNPEGFVPERFDAEADPRKRHKFCYLPFGAGPRNCIGSTFATLEMQMVIPTLLQRFEVDLLPGHQVHLQPLLTLRPRGGMPMLPREI